ncbi:MAG: trypsin-like peptidase domain-containing protein [Candidatus Dormiibacterota bacterium]
MPSIATVVANLGGGSYDQGSAFAIQSEGGATWLLTNNHVVRGASQISVIFENGAHYVAQLRGTDADEDVAVLGVPTQVPVLTLGDSSRVVVGQPVVAIGSPEGLQGTVTTGIISAPHRTLTVTDENGKNPETLADAMQTDAAINPGNSGGPLFDARGDVIGMNTAGATGANDLSFAIPSLVARRIATNLIAGKAPGNTYAGLCYLSSEDAVAAGKSFSGYGALVTGTVAAGPAANAGIQTGDVIEKLAGTPLNDGETVGGVLQLHNPGDTISVALTRSGESRTVNLTLGDQPASHVSC